MSSVIMETAVQSQKDTTKDINERIENHYKKYSREQDLEILARVLAKNMFYGDWKWETPNERLMEYQMRKLGLYPFCNEDEMIVKTAIDGNEYLAAKENVS